MKSPSSRPFGQMVQLHDALAVNSRRCLMRSFQSAASWPSRRRNPAVRSREDELRSRQHPVNEAQDLGPARARVVVGGDDPGRCRLDRMPLMLGEEDRGLDVPC